MSSIVHPGDAGRWHTTGYDERANNSWFDWVVIVLSSWLFGGFFLDVWAHHHIPSTLETFFTPWHGVLYSGFVAVAGLLLATLIRNRLHGDAWSQALPAGYGLSLLGVLLFALGGIGDLLWHLLFGIEVNLEAVLSPTHLVLFFAGGLILSGPLRAAWRRPGASAGDGWARQLPMLVSLAFVLAIVTSVTEFANPFGYLWPAAGHETVPVALGRALGIAAILLQTGLLMGVTLLAVRRWQLPFGSLTLVYALGTTFAPLVHDQYLVVPVAILSGLAADLLLRWLRPSPVRVIAWRLFALAVAVVLWALYFLALALTTGIAWSIHLWAGAIALAAVAGWLLSYLLVPPTVPAES